MLVTPDTKNSGRLQLKSVDGLATNSNTSDKAAANRKTVYYAAANRKLVDHAAANRPRYN